MQFSFDRHRRMKHVCVIALFLLYAVPVLLWPLEESLHPLPASLGKTYKERSAKHIINLFLTKRFKF